MGAVEVRFLVPASGAVMGLFLGLVVGQVFRVYLEGLIVDLTYPAGLVGVILGYFAGYLLERRYRT